MRVSIDKQSGFCFGVINAIKTAEEELEKYDTLFCLGDIVHNNKEVERLKKKGLIIINHQDFRKLYNTRVLIRAHGEPPETYQIARENQIDIIDASCPVVLKLQNKVKKGYNEITSEKGQVVIFGKVGHAEVNGLSGQTGNNAIIVDSNYENFEQIDFSRPINLYSQTTQSKGKYLELIERIRSELTRKNCNPDKSLNVFHTICGQVSNRGPHLAEFAKNHDIIVFVSGLKSSNGKYLFEICLQNNPNSFFIAGKEDLRKEWFENVNHAGVCGATSTPMWLMEEVAGQIRDFSGIS
ncbi:MAG: 4-hydroxy-3-methylbut-2-enyl diphosphate reductase [Bacteroidetes bacterium]|nr:MAG: 4-hydroxy-3-methylbut-2-enyl diphosphate reductase [Bacteroidota bacterium]